MQLVTISTKVEKSMVEEIVRTGYSISEMMQASVQMFLKLAPEQQQELIWRNYQRKMLKRARIRSQAIKKERGLQTEGTKVI